ncbi:MAG: HipA domain-containing protein [Flavobacteriales bacterium]|nr:HipA domain-containing protein [Flavobacteriales bacterium]
MKNYKHTLGLKQNSGTTNLVAEPSGQYSFKNCLYCYKPLTSKEQNFHKACVKRFFGQACVPQLEYSANDLGQLAKEVIQSQMAVTGVQPKISLSIFRKSADNAVKKLTIVGLYGSYILKPQSEHYSQLPEVEDVTMHIADLCGIHAVPHSLVKLADGTVCYITKRIDRNKKNKLAMEDMCQLTERLTEDKYKGSYEQIAKTVLKYSTNPLFDVSSFFEQVLLSYFTGNADMHLKNFSMWQPSEDAFVLAPAYDLVNTALVNPMDTEELALTLNGKKSNFKYSDFVKAFETLHLSQKVLDKILYNFYYCKHEMHNMVNRSFLTDDNKNLYIEIMEKRFELVPKGMFE